ncbi:MAG TPA: glycosyltransferase family 4 protein [Cellulomonas sp.]
MVDHGSAGRRLVHVITPGDHFSPRTGSAVPTVVNGLSRATPQDRPRPAVVVARGTYLPRYESADAWEYDEEPVRRRDRYTDAARARLGMPRTGARRAWAAALSSQEDWDPACVLLHNAPQAVALVDADRHEPVLYAHNQLLRTYTEHEAGRALENASRIVCVSEYLAAATAERLPPSLRGRVRVVRNGVDTDALRPDPAHVTGPMVEVAFVGRVIPDKGPDVLVRALAELARDDVHATIVGSPGFAPDEPLTAYELQLRELAQPVGDRVAFRTFVPRDEAARVLQAADVVVVPSVWPDPCPLTVLEGMASGAVVVASRIGGIPEQMHEAGVIVPPGNVQALAGALAALADDRGALADGRRRARAHAEANDWSVVWHRLDEALRT